jgi:hypothetical protein
MKTLIHTIHRTAWCLFLTAAFSASAQARFAVTSYTDRGGGSTSGGTFTVFGTEGQSDAGTTTDVGGFGVSGGFWSMVEEAPPHLTIRREGNQVVLSWPNPSTGFQLQEASAFSGSGWVDVAVAPSIVGANLEVTLTIGPGSRWLRLRRP